MELVKKKEFIAATLDSKDMIFVVHIASLSIPNTNKVYSSCRAKIDSLKVDQACITIFAKYSNFADGLSLKLAAKLPEHTRIINNAIDLTGSKQSPYVPIYRLR